MNETGLSTKLTADAANISVAKGGVQLTSMKELTNFARLILQSGFAPKEYQGKPAAVIIAIQTGAELGLKPLQSLQGIAVINGKPSLYGDALMALVHSSGQLEDMQETFDEKSMTATCKVKRKGVATYYTETFSMQDAEAAGLRGKGGPWQQYPKRMLRWRARSWAMRAAFADLLCGVVPYEEAVDMGGPRDTITSGDVVPPADLDDLIPAGPETEAPAVDPDEPPPEDADLLAKLERGEA